MKPKFQYFVWPCDPRYTPLEIESTLNENAKRGWRLITVDHHKYIFEREAVSDNAPPSSLKLNADGSGEVHGARITLDQQGLVGIINPA